MNLPKPNHLPDQPPDLSGANTAAAGSKGKTLAQQTAWQSLATAGSLGFTLVGCTFLGLFIGYNMDRWLQTHPCFTIILLLFGIVSGFINIFVFMSRPLPNSSKHHEKPGS